MGAGALAAGVFGGAVFLLAGIVPVLVWPKEPSSEEQPHTAMSAHMLMERFRALGGIINATKEELMQVEGIGEVQADRIMEKLNSEGLRHQ